jgi:hypothetical protein
MDFSDMTYHHMATLSIWGSIELNLAIICACLTTFKPLIVRVFPKLLKSSRMATPRTLAYTDRATGTAVSGHGTRPKRESSSFARLEDADSNDSAGCEMDELEDQVQRGVYMAAPAKAYTRLP